MKNSKVYKTVTILIGIIGVLLIAAEAMSIGKGSAKAISIIGGADGPTSIFIAGKTGTEMMAAGIVVGVILVVIAVVLWFRKKK